MEYKGFLVNVKETLKSYLDSENKNYAVNIRKVLKNNGIELDALTIVDLNCKTSPTIYLNSYYNEFSEGRSIDEITGEIYSLFKENMGKININVEEFADFSKIKNCIVFKLINAEKNTKLLKCVPHIKKLDLAIVFYCLIKCSDIENATTLIYNQHMDMWGVDLDDIYEQAIKNTPVLLPCEIKSMGDIIKEMLKENPNYQEMHEDGFYGEKETDFLADMIMEELGKDDGEPQMYVLTNKYRLNGAAAMLYEGILRDFALQHQKDIIILPSSIHEVILIPMEPEMRMEDFRMMIKEVNSEEVEPSDVLSEHAYMYILERDEITM